MGSSGLEGFIAQLEKGFTSSGTASRTSSGVVQTAAQTNAEGSSLGFLKGQFGLGEDRVEHPHEGGVFNYIQQREPSTEPLAATREAAVTSRPPPIVPELSVEQRTAELDKVRNAIYAAARIKSRGKEFPLILPYQAHMAPDEFKAVVGEFMSHTTPPWLFSVDEQRYLLREENPSTDLFQSTYNYINEDYNKVFVSVWQETSRGSNTWQLLGSVRTPARVAFAPLRNNVLDQSLYWIRKYRVITSAAFECVVD